MPELAASRGWAPLRLKELWDYRELLYFLVWRDVKVRYKQTAFGAGWAIIQPLMTMVVFSIVFSGFADIEAPGGLLLLLFLPRPLPGALVLCGSRFLHSSPPPSVL